MNDRTKWMVLTLCTLTMIMGIFLVGTQSYFNIKEINNASDQCYEIGGTPEVESDFMAINYSFECHTAEGSE
ncbi:hypothetical protein ACQ4XT_12975 [Halobacillus faecis]